MRGVVLLMGTASVLLLAGCTAPNANCTAGYSPTFPLTLAQGAGEELAVRFCDADHCSPVPTAGAIPSLFLDREDDHAATVRHLGRGEWSVSLRGAAPGPPTAEIELFRAGRLVATRSVRLHWRPFDPCARSNPPAPHPTVTAP